MMSPLLNKVAIHFGQLSWKSWATYVGTRCSTFSAILGWTPSPGRGSEPACPEPTSPRKRSLRHVRWLLRSVLRPTSFAPTRMTCRRCWMRSSTSLLRPTASSRGFLTYLLGILALGAVFTRSRYNRLLTLHRTGETVLVQCKHSYR